MLPYPFLVLFTVSIVSVKTPVAKRGIVLFLYTWIGKKTLIYEHKCTSNDYKNFFSVRFVMCYTDFDTFRVLGRHNLAIAKCKHLPT